MKRLIVFSALLAIVSSAPAATIGNWNVSSGNWGDGTSWTQAIMPVPVNVGGDEIKIQQDSSANVGPQTVNLNTSVDYINYPGFTWTTGKGIDLTTGGDSAAKMTTINLAAGTNFAIMGFRVGAVRGAAVSGYAQMFQTGGLLSVGTLTIGRGTSGQTAIGSGSYTISGGTLAYNTGGASNFSGGLYVGSGSNTTSSTAEKIVGNFIVDGANASILMKKMYVGSETSTRIGTGTVEFRIGNAGVSRIQLDGAGIYLDGVGAGGNSNGIANLVLSSTGTSMPVGNIVLVENLASTGIVNGVFESLNGVVGAAAEGASVVLGGNTYTLTYKYAAGTDSVANDIALVIPEPATLVVLGLGGLLLRRRLA